MLECFVMADATTLTEAATREDVEKHRSEALAGCNYDIERAQRASSTSTR